MHIEIQNCFSFWGTSSPKHPTGASPLDPTGGLLSPRPPAQDVPHILYQVYALHENYCIIVHYEDTMRTVNYENLYFHDITLCSLDVTVNFGGKWFPAPWKKWPVRLWNPPSSLSEIRYKYNSVLTYIPVSFLFSFIFRVRVRVKNRVRVRVSFRVRVRLRVRVRDR